jgi:hypothetical protein
MEKLNTRKNGHIEIENIGLRPNDQKKSILNQQDFLKEISTRFNVVCHTYQIDMRIRMY